jgi:hypothetical protein
MQRREKSADFDDSHFEKVGRVGLTITQTGEDPGLSLN